MMIRYLSSVTASYCEKRKWSWMRDRLASRKQNSAFEENKNTSPVCHIFSSLVIQPFIQMFLVPEESQPLPWPRDKSCTPYSSGHLQLIGEVNPLLLPDILSRCAALLLFCFDSVLHIPRFTKYTGAFAPLQSLLLSKNFLPSDIRLRNTMFNWVNNLQIYSMMLTKRKWQMTWVSPD